MRIISFAWTTKAVQADPPRKSVTRRRWKPQYAARFKKDDLVAAYNRDPRYGGEQFAIVRLTADPSLERTNSVPDEDWEREGFAYLTEVGTEADRAFAQKIWDEWKSAPNDDMIWVVRFEKVAWKPAPEPAGKRDAREGLPDARRGP